MPKDTHSTLPVGPELVLPERVTVALAQLAGAAREGLLASPSAPGSGSSGSCWPPMSSDWLGPRPPSARPDRGPPRHPARPGHPRRPPVRVARPRVRSADGAHELPLPTWQVFAATELLDQLTLERMLAKLSCRRYQHGLEPVGSGVEQTATGTSKSAVSRRFVAATEQALAELLAQALSGLDLGRCWWTASG
jgi:putative transposase